MRRISCFVVVGILLIISSCNKPNIKVKLASQIDTVSYYIGVLSAKSLQKNNGVERINPEALAMGYAQVYANDSIKTPDMEMQRKVQSYIVELQKVSGEKNLKEGQEFLDKNKNNPGIILLPDGLQYKVIKEGNGPKPDSTDVVSINYIGSTIDGKEFDNSYKTGTPLKIPVSNSIKGFSEALKMMKVGSKWKLFIPAKLAYGERNMQRIKPNSVLIFDIELLEIVPKQPKK